MRALAVAGKTLRELRREPALLGVALLFPALLVVIYGAAFGPATQRTSQLFRIYVQAPAAPGGEATSEAAALVSALREARFERAPVFDVRVNAAPEAVEVALREQRAALAVEVPGSFASDVARARSDPRAPAPAVVLRGDTASFNFLFAKGFVDVALEALARRDAARDAAPPTAWEYLPGTGTQSDFNTGVPGLLVFGVLFLVVTSATLLVRESVNGTLRRLQLSRMSARDLLVGLTLAQLAVAAAQVTLTLAVARAYGFNGRGSLPLVGVIVLLGALAAVGVGLAVACFARTDGEATNLATGAMLPMAFLSGAVYPLPSMRIATMAGRPIGAMDFLPTTHAVEALRRVLIFGDGPRRVAFELAAMVLISAAVLAAGVALFQRRRLRAAA